MNAVRRWLSRVDAGLYAPAPPQRLASLRIAVGAYALCYLLIRAPNLSSVARFPSAAFEPVGPVTWLASPLPAWAVYALTALAAVAGIAFLLGFRYRLSGPLFALLLLWVTSYRSSWGMKFHTENLVALHLILLACAPAADAFSLDARRRARSASDAEPSAPHGRYGWAIRAMAAVTVATYVLAGVAKLRIAGLAWAQGDVLRQHVAYDNLRKLELGSLYSPIAPWLVKQGWLFPPLAGLTLLVELGAPLALFSARLARVWSVGAWLFHWGVLAFMAIAFPYQLSFIPYLSFFEPERRWPFKGFRSQNA